MDKLQDPWLCVYNAGDTFIHKQLKKLLSLLRAFAIANTIYRMSLLSGLAMLNRIGNLITLEKFSKDL